MKAAQNNADGRRHIDMERFLCCFKNSYQPAYVVNNGPLELLADAVLPRALVARRRAVTRL
jgi:hypothetical protein